MISDDKLRSWCEMIAASDSKIEFPLGVEKGSVWQTKPPYPDLMAVDVEEIQVRRFMFQRLSVVARMDETDEEGHVQVSRLVAELENGAQIELSKIVEPVTNSEPSEDDNICRACDLPIVDETEKIFHDGRPYHRRCMT